jgi:hypothetical protein
MSTATATSEYRRMNNARASTDRGNHYMHTQRGVLISFILIAFALCAIAPVALRSFQGKPVDWTLVMSTIPVAALMLVLALSLTTLTIKSDTECNHLTVCFGPIPLWSCCCKSSIPLDRVTSFTRRKVRCTIGVHLVLDSRGSPVWLWNVATGDTILVQWCRDADVLNSEGSCCLEIGTDDAEGLVAFLERRCTAATCNRG